MKFDHNFFQFFFEVHRFSEHERKFGKTHKLVYFHLKLINFLIKSFLYKTFKYFFFYCTFPNLNIFFFSLNIFNPFTFNLNFFSKNLKWKEPNTCLLFTFFNFFLWLHSVLKSADFFILWKFFVILISITKNTLESFF